MYYGGSVEEARQALATLQEVEVLKVAVRGDLRVAETDLVGRPISWRLPIHLAITDAELEHAVLDAFDRGAEHATATSDEVRTRPSPRIDDGDPAPREHRSRNRPAAA